MKTTAGSAKEFSTLTLKFERAPFKFPRSLKLYTWTLKFQANDVLNTVLQLHRYLYSNVAPESKKEAAYL